MPRNTQGPAWRSPEARITPAGPRLAKASTSCTKVDAFCAAPSRARPCNIQAGPRPEPESGTPWLPPEPPSPAPSPDGHMAAIWAASRGVWASRGGGDRRAARGRWRCGILCSGGHSRRLCGAREPNHMQQRGLGRVDMNVRLRDCHAWKCQIGGAFPPDFPDRCEI